MQALFFNNMDILNNNNNHCIQYQEDSQHSICFQLFLFLVHYDVAYGKTYFNFFSLLQDSISRNLIVIVTMVIITGVIDLTMALEDNYRLVHPLVYGSIENNFKVVI